MACVKCGSIFYLKSNQAVWEELHRISRYLEPPVEPSCPFSRCENASQGVISSPGAYYTDGKTPTGSQRYKCRSCGHRFSVKGPTVGQKKPHENKLVFKLLVNKNSIRSIARIAELSPKAVYDKIDFIHRQCLLFVADREQDLQKLRLRRLFISTDRQDYQVNWTDRKNKGNVQLTAVASAESRTGYVFPMSINYDPDVDVEAAVEAAKANGDLDGRPDGFRESARIWLPDETRPPPRPLAVREHLPAEQKFGMPDLEAVEDLHPKHQLPRHGAQVHFEYTCYAHYRLLRRLVGHAGKLRFFMDEDGALQAAFKTAFADRIRADEVDGAAVKINKSLTVDERRTLVAETKRLVDEYRAAAGLADFSDAEVRLDLLGHEIATFIELLTTKKDSELKEIDPMLKKGWFWYPFNTMAEPHKRIKVLNDWSIKDDLHAARLMKRASLHAIDRFFMQIRRLVMMLERPISTPSNDGRVWRGYSAYNPRIIQKLLDIYRVYYNYVAVGEDKRTPAMRLGLAMGPVKLETILYFDPLASRLPEEQPKPRRRAAPTGSLARPRRKPPIAPAVKERLGATRNNESS